MAGFFWDYHRPQIKKWLLVKLEQESSKNLPIRLWAQDAEITFVPPRIQLRKIRYLPQDGAYKEVLAPGEIEAAAINLSIGALLKGQIRISKIQIDHPTLKFIFKTSPKENVGEKKSFKIPLSEIDRFPVDDLTVQDADIIVAINNVALHSTDLDFEISNRYRSVFVQATTPHLFVKELGKPDGVPFEVETRFLLEPDEINITALKIKKAKSFLVGAGIVKGPIEQGKFSESDVKLRISSALPEVQGFLNVIKPGLKIPALQGKANADLSFKLTPTHLVPEVHYRLSTQDVKIDQFVLGKLVSEGVATTKFLNADKTSIKTEAGELHLEKLNFEFGDPTNVSFISNFKKIDLHQLLEDLNVHNVPLKLNFSGHVPCKGSVYPHLMVKCQGQMEGENFKLFNDKKEKSMIVAAKNFSATGEFGVSSTAVDYQADMKAGKNSTGKSNGRIVYDQGFNINYETDHLETSDIENLVDLKFEGVAQIKGSTEGDSQSAVLDLNGFFKDFWLEDYEFGNLQTHVSYKNGMLGFRKSSGNLHNTRYQGNVDLNLRSHSIALQMQAPYAEVDDLKKAVWRKLPIPFHLSGTGVLDFKGSGPLALNQMSYNLKSSFYRGDVAGESYDELKINLSATNGNVRSETMSLTKRGNTATFKGTVSPRWIIDGVIEGQKFQLEQSEMVEHLGLSITGLLDFQMQFKGPIQHPDMDLNGTLLKVTASDQALENSKFRIHVLKDRVESTIRLFGSTVIGNLTYPLETKAPFELGLKLNDWDFTRYFSIFAETNRQRDFETHITGLVDLKSAQGGFWHSNGKIEIQDALLRRGNLSLSNEKPLVMAFQDGLMRTQFFELTGENAYLKVQTMSSNREQIDLRLNSHIDLNLLSLLTPFMADLRGNLDLALSAKGQIDEPTLQGTAFIDKGFFRFKEFPHSFEDIRSELVLANKKLNISSLHGNLGGGRINAEGSILFNSMSNVPVTSSGRFENVTLMVPDGFKTHGSGDVKLEGTRFPYTLSIQYDVDSGMITKEIENASTFTKQVQPSSFLPKFLDRENFEPFIFDFNVNLKNPVHAKNSYVDAMFSGQMNVVGPPSKLKMTGRLLAQKNGKIFFRNTPFELLTGTAEFLNDPPDNPKMYIQARSRVTEQTPDNRPQAYDIDLIAQGRPKNPTDLKLTLSSQPALPQQQIVSLLALGMTMNTNSTMQIQRSSDTQNNSLATQSSVQLGTALLQKPIGDQIKNRLGVDMQISSAYAQAEAGTVPKVTFSKQWTPKFIGSASRTIEKSPTNLVRLEYKMNKNVSVIGSWEGRSTDTSPVNASSAGTLLQQPQRDPTASILGLDLEYKLEFR